MTATTVAPEEIEVVTLDDIIEEEDHQKSLGELLVEASRESDVSETARKVAIETTREALSVIDAKFAELSAKQIANGKPPTGHGIGSWLVRETEEAIQNNMGVQPVLLLDDEHYHLPTSNAHAKVWVGLARLAGKRNGSELPLSEGFKLARTLYQGGLTEEADAVLNESTTTAQVLTGWQAILDKQAEDETEGETEEKDTRKSPANLIPGSSTVETFYALLEGTAKPEKAAEYGPMTAEVIGTAMVKIGALKAALTAVEAALEGFTPEQDAEASEEASESTLAPF